MDNDPDKNSHPITESPLGKVALDYIHHPLLQNVDKSNIIFNDSVNVADEKNLQILLDNSNKELRMYGTAKELAGNLKVYQNFPLEHKKFNFENKNTIIKCMPLRSLKKDIFYCKQYFLARLRTALLDIYRFSKQNPPPEVLDYMKEQENRLDECYELSRYDDHSFERIIDNVQSLMAVERKNETPIGFSPIENKRKPQLDVYGSEKVLEVLETTISSNPQLFLPYSEMRNENMPIVVRIFEDGSEKFVMTSELFKSKKIKKVGKKFECQTCLDCRGILCTIDLRDVFKTLRNQLNLIDFVRTRITRAKHAAVPIVTPSGNHCILAADALLELLSHIISALKIFQKVKNDTWSTVTEFMTMLESTFRFDVEHKFLIYSTVCNEMKTFNESYWKNIEKMSATPVRTGTGGFAVKDLKDELKYLGLTDVFPEIIDYAEDVYSEVNRQKNKKYLRDCDMFDASEHCQLICILNRFPNLKKFLHTQKACHRVPLLKCELCPKTIRTSITREATVNIHLPEESHKPELTKNEMPETEVESVTEEEVKDLKESETTENANESSDMMDESKEKEEVLNVENKEDVQLINRSESIVNESECCSKCLIIKEENVELKNGFGSVQKRLTVLEEKLPSNQNETNRLLNEAKLKWKEVNVYETECTEKMMKMEDKCNELSERNQALEQEMTRLQQQTATDKIENARKQSQLEKGISTKNRIVNELTEKNRSLDNEVNRLKQKTTADQKASVSKKNQLEKEISDNKKINIELVEKNRTLEQEMSHLKQSANANQMKMKKDFAAKTSENERVINELMEKNRKLEQDIIHLNQKIDKDLVENAKQQSHLEKEISEKRRTNIELKTSNSNLSIQNEKHEKIIQTLRNILAVAPSKSSNQSDQTVSRKEDETPGGMRFQLVGFQKIKDSFRKRNPLKHAEDMVEKLISLTTRPEIQQLANFELAQFEMKFRNYSQTVEMNIQKLKDTGHCKDISLLPELPSFSERFMKEYWSEMEKQPSTSSGRPSELADSECLICLVNMESSDETIKCENCRRRFHSECASEWLKRKSVCPACSRGLLDPSEFPSLG